MQDMIKKFELRKNGQLKYASTSIEGARIDGWQKHLKIDQTTHRAIRNISKSVTLPGSDNNTDQPDVSVEMDNTKASILEAKYFEMSMAYEENPLKKLV